MNAALNGMVSRHGFPDTDSNITGVHMPFKIKGMGNTDFLVFFIKKKEVETNIRSVVPIEC